MKPIRLIDLPLAPANKEGWPWNFGCTHLPAKMDNGSLWPRISLVTPSYNQSRFLEETLRSVLLQGYSNLEYIVMDGGSTDGSIEILQKYAQYFDYWTTAKDEGHAHALISGFKRSTGVILGFVNSDDVLMPNALSTVGRFFVAHPEVDLVVGKSLIYDSSSQIIYRVLGLAPTFRSLLFYGSAGFNQPASFWKKRAMFEVGGFDASMQFSFDYDMYLRLTKRRKACHIDKYLAAFRIHPESKTSTIRYVQRENDTILQDRYGLNTYHFITRKIMAIFYRLRYLFFTMLFKIKTTVGLDSIPRLYRQEKLPKDKVI
jgi:glycosyltransferase involved in cell wall biosynthesis